MLSSAQHHLSLPFSTWDGLSHDVYLLLPLLEDEIPLCPHSHAVGWGQGNVSAFLCNVLFQSSAHIQQQTKIPSLHGSIWSTHAYSLPLSLLWEWGSLRGGREDVWGQLLLQWSEHVLSEVTPSQPTRSAQVPTLSMCWGARVPPVCFVKPLISSALVQLSF